MKSAVLILGVEPRITIPIARSLHAHGVPVEVASLSSTEPTPRSRAISNFVRLRRPGRQKDSQTPSFLNFLDDVISKRRYDMLIPATDAALALLCQYDKCLRELLYVACPPAHVIDRILNKSLTLEFASRAGVPTPPTYHFANVSELERFANQLRFPLIAKPRHKSHEMGFKLRHFPSYNLLHQAFTEGDQFGSAVLLQEVVPGNGVGVEVLMHHGEVVAIFQHCRLKEFPAKGGAAAVAIAEAPEPMLVDQALALLRALEWEGIAMVEFRYQSAQHQSFLMEVNGRYWGTLALPIRAGVEFPWYEWQIAHGEKPTVPVGYPVGGDWRWSAGYIRRWHGLAISAARTAFRRPAESIELLPSMADLRAPDALWDPTDPMPAIVEPLRAIKDLVRSDSKAIWQLLRRSGDSK